MEKLSLENEREVRIYNKGIQTKIEHLEPSQKTLDKFENMDNKLDNLKSELNQFKLDIVKEIAELPDKLENKFAPKWVADAMKLFMATVSIGIISAFLSIILKK